MASQNSTVLTSTTPLFLLQMMLVDIMFNSPHHRFSEHDQRAILSLCTSLGAKGVPSLYQYQEWKRWFSENLGHPAVKFTSPSGNIFYINDIMKSLELVRQIP